MISKFVVEIYSKVLYMKDAQMGLRSPLYIAIVSAS